MAPTAERAVLLEYLEHYRRTFERKCEGLDAEQLARRSVEPSTLSLLGLLRHLAKVEQVWFRIPMEGNDIPRLYVTADEPDGDFDGAIHRSGSDHHGGQRHPAALRLRRRA